MRRVRALVNGLRFLPHDVREGCVSVGPVVVMSQRKARARDRNTFEIGVDFGVEHGPLMPKKTERHLHVV